MASGSEQKSGSREVATSVANAVEMEYESQFFKFSPRAFVDSVYNSMIERLEETLDKLKNDVSRNYSGIMTEQEIDEALTNVSERMVQFMNDQFSSFEKYVVEMIFSIPPHVCLPEDKAHEDERLKSLNKQQILADIRELEKQLSTLTFMDGKLTDELGIIEQVRERQNNSKANLQKALDISHRLEQQRREDEEEVNAVLEFIETMKVTGNGEGARMKK